MNKHIHCCVLLFFIAAYSTIIAKEGSSVGYYQTINIDSESPCNCSDKTQRTYDLAKGLRPADVIEYELHTYKFTFGSSVLPASKLFKALENDASVYKVSMKEWDSFMLLTTKDFDVASFEAAAIKAFGSFSMMLPEYFLKDKNVESYNEYMKKLEKETGIQTGNSSDQINTR